MGQIVTAADVKAVMPRRSLGASFDAAIEEVVADLEFKLEAYLGRPVAPGSRTDTFTIAELGAADYVRLEAAPVTAVASVTVDGVAQVEGTNYTALPHGLGDLSLSGDDADVVSVSYTGGAIEDVFAPTVRSAAVRAVVKMLDDIQAAEQAGVEGYTIKPIPGDFTGEELARVHRHRRRRIGGRFR